MSELSLVNPFRCRMWDLHERLDTEITEETCKVEIESFLKEGQLIPTRGRRLKGDPVYEVELIYGARRLFVARHLNMPLAVELQDISDRDGIIAMDIENRQRRDISPYERGRSCARWLSAEYFKSREDLARALHLSNSQVSRLLRLAQLPSSIVSAFANPADMRERWGLELVEMWEDVEKRPLLSRVANEIRGMTPRPPVLEIYQRLLQSVAWDRRRSGRSCEETVTGASGSALFRVRRQSRAFTLLFPADRVSEEALERIEDAVLRIVRDLSTRRTARYIDHPNASSSYYSGLQT